MRYRVYIGDRMLRETCAVSAAQAVSRVRYSMFGARPGDGLGLRAEPVEESVDVSALPCSRSARALYPGARAIRRRCWA